MSRDTPKAPTVGHCKCPNPHCGQVAAIRRNRSGKYYAVCQKCGPIYWLTAEGQEFFLNEGTIWGAGGAPADIPAWIREGKVAPRTRIESVPGISPPAPVAEVEKKPVPAPAAPAKVPTSASKPAYRPWWQF